MNENRGRRRFKIPIQCYEQEQEVLVDTGAAISTVSKKVAEQLGLPQFVVDTQVISILSNTRA
ncbi:uncharacterized protein EV154DRAFT_571685 [Mucor mucedo]|uniref:uncharacterized protein n=1 Tax=Mucor mucedo TaxID=29922 RepID=UPI002220FD36|nr:uncharacterized protein EV154DRAFT_571685 [Mucor mucedo]KAI7867342.1 hypothetical protein EV154DRAFT_571685 [Mucor mucedo]